jgi:hypothetical protein
LEINKNDYYNSSFNEITFHPFSIMNVEIFSTNQITKDKLLIKESFLQKTNKYNIFINIID